MAFEALKLLMSYAISYFCMCTNVLFNSDRKNYYKKRNRLQLENDLFISVSKIELRFNKLLKNKQAQSSHLNYSIFTLM